MWILRICLVFTIFCQILSLQVDILTCPDRMEPFPGLEPKTWVCDCIEPFIYHADTNSCHEAFFQDPCPNDYYLVFPPGELNAKCEKNPCHENGVVPFNGSCVRLYTFGPHCPDKFTQLIVNYNHELHCSASGFYDTRKIINAPIIGCEKGSRRNSLGLCKRVFE